VAVSDTLERRKAAQACGILEELDIDCWLIWVRETSLQADPALAFVCPVSFVWQTALLYTRSGERVALVGNFDAAGVPDGLFDRVVTYESAASGPLRRVLEELDPRRIAIDVSESDPACDGMGAGMRSLLARFLEGTPYAERLVSAEELIGKLRGRKLPEEVALISEAVRTTEEILDEIAREVRVGQTEIEIQRLVRRAMETRGVGHAWASDHNPAVDAGPDKPFGHGGPTGRRTRSGELLHFDFGVKVDGYCADLQRMLYFGEPEEIPEEVQAAFDAVSGAIVAAAAALRPGVRGHEVDAVARGHVTDLGYPEYMHALGHQLGRNAHDGGTLLGPRWERYGRTPEGVVEEGNVFTLELHVPTSMHGQVSLEEDVLVTSEGCRFLSVPQRRIRCVG
jgi:Xaa-Pro aminopeptidase